MLIGICAIVKNEGPYIYEWIAYHKLIGVDYFLIFDNESTDNTSEILNNLTNKKIIDSVKWQTEANKSPQLQAYNEGITLAREKCDFLINIDIDEFISLNNCNLKVFFENLDPDVSAIALSQKIVGSSGIKLFDHGLVLERFRNASERNYHENYFFKSAYRPKNVSKFLSVHKVQITQGKFIHPNGFLVEDEGNFLGRAKLIDHESIILYHFILKSYEEFQIKKNRGGAAAQTKEERIARYSDEFFNNRDINANKESINCFDSYVIEIKKLINDLKT